LSGKQAHDPAHQWLPEAEQVGDLMLGMNGRASQPVAQAQDGPIAFRQLGEHRRRQGLQGAAERFKSCQLADLLSLAAPPTELRQTPVTARMGGASGRPVHLPAAHVATHQVTTRRIGQSFEHAWGRNCASMCCAWTRTPGTYSYQNAGPPVASYRFHLTSESG
jgi:hypothetical protein